MQADLWIVTGAAGQLGRAVVEEFLLRGLEVLTCDRVDGSSSISGRPLNWTKEDLSSPSEGLAWPPEARGIIHLAGSKRDEAFSVDTAASLLCANLLTVAGALAACQGHVRRFICVSSISVYDPSIKGAISEEARVRPKTAYGISKLLGEMACRIFARGDSQREVVIVRLAQVYGPGTWERNAVYRLIEQATSTRRLILSCGSQLQRDYIHLDDAKRALVDAALKCPGGVYNIGCGGPVTVGQIASIIDEAVPGCEEPKFSSVADTGSVGRYLSTRRFVTVTGFSPAIALDQGLRREVESRLSKAGDLVSAD